MPDLPIPSGAVGSAYKNVFYEVSEELDEKMNEGLALKKDQGFQFLTTDDKAFLLAYLYGKDDKGIPFGKFKAFSIAVLGLEIINLSMQQELKIRTASNLRWKKIEEKMGGVRNIISMMGVDIIEIIDHARRLLSAQKKIIDRNGTEHSMDDGSTQMKALEFLSKISGNYNEENDQTKKIALNIRFDLTPKPANPEDIEDENMEVFQGEAEEIE